MGQKIVIIGAGSMAFTTTIVSTLFADPFYKGCTVGLVDIDAENLEIMRKYLERANEELGHQIHFEASTDRKELLPGADIVTISIAVGGNEAFKRDLDIPTKYGFVQPDGESLGPGGISRALRHVYEIVNIAKDMEQLCPNARMYNFTNPLPIVVQAVNQLTSIRCVGLCIGVELTKRFACEFMELNPEEVTAKAAGINHFHFLTELLYKGEDIYPEFRKRVREMFEKDDLNTLAKEQKYKKTVGHFDELLLSLAICDRMGYFPGPGDHHIGEFYPHWFTSTEDQRIRHPFDQAYIQKVLKTYPEFHKKVYNQAMGIEPLDREMLTVGKTWEESQMADIERAMRENTGEIFHINIPNKGYITNLPDGVVVEIPAHVDASGYHPLAMGDLPNTIIPYISRHAYNIQNIIDAAVTGDRWLAMAALANDPNCFDLEIGEKCLNELIDAQLEYLPQFRK